MGEQAADVADAADVTRVDCTRCGTCCFSESPRHAQVTGDDHERLGDNADELVIFLENKAFMRIVPVATGLPFQRCIALVLDATNGTFMCSVYERRPEVCRALARASPGCHGELATKGERPKRSLTLLRA